MEKPKTLSPGQFAILPQAYSISPSPHSNILEPDIQGRTTCYKQSLRIKV